MGCSDCDCASMMFSWVGSAYATKNSTNDHKRRSRIALQHQRPYCRPAHRNFASKVRCRRLYETIISISATFSPDLPFSRHPAGNGRATAIPCASHSEVSGRVGTRKFDQMRIKICNKAYLKPLNLRFDC